MTQRDLPAILLTRVQQVYAILAAVADNPKTVEDGGEHHCEEMAPVLASSFEENDDISAGHDRTGIGEEEVR